MDISIEHSGFRIKHLDILIIISQCGKNRWSYDFYRGKIESEEKMEPVCAPFEVEGFPWKQSRYKDSLITKALILALNSKKEETIGLVNEITTELYKISDDYIDFQNMKSGYDYKNTVDGIPTFFLKGKIHPAMDFYKNKLFLGYRFMDEMQEKKEWFVDSDKKIWTANSLLEQEKVLVKDKIIIGEPRWENIQLLRDQIITPYNLFMMIKTKLKHHIWFSNPLSYDILSTWIMGTYMYWAFDSYPYMHLSGTPDSGKSRVQRLSSCLSFNGYFTESISGSSIFRYVEEMRATLHVDEQEFLGSDNNLEVISILNSGYHKAGNATRQESYTDCDGNKKFQTISFSTYSPKMLSGIRGLDKTLQTRSISISMKPTTEKEYSRREIFTNEPTWQYIRDLLYCWALSSFDDVMASYNKVRDLDIPIRNRMWQKYHVLIALAYYFKQNVSSSDVYDNIIKFIQEDQIKSLEWDDYLIDFVYKVLWRCVNKYPHPKGQIPLKTIREEAAFSLGFQPPFDTAFFEEHRNLSYIKNIHTVLTGIGYKSVAGGGNYRVVYAKKEVLKAESESRGINIESPIIIM